MVDGLARCAQNTEMNLEEFLRSRTKDERAAFCAKLDRHPMYVYGVSKQHRKAGAKLALQIEALTDGLVPRWELRADLWAPPTNGSKKKSKSKSTAPTARKPRRTPKGAQT